MSEINKPISLLIASYQSAVYAKNADTFIRMYDDDVKVFDAWGVWSYKGSAQWKIAVKGWFMSLGTETVKVRFDEVQTSVGRELSLVSAIITYAAYSAQGEMTRETQNRLTWVLKTTGHVPRIVHEHTSVPIGFEDLKGITHRLET